MTRTPLVIFLAALAALMLAQPWRVDQAKVVLAGDVSSSPALLDSDGDTVPDCVEWLLQTDPHEKDSDDDGADDFVEIVNFTSHRDDSDPPLADHRIRLLLTSTPNPRGAHLPSQLWLHVLLNYVGTEVSSVSFRDLFLDVRGKRVSLLPVIGYGEVEVKWRVDREYGTLCRVSCELPSVESIKSLLPATFGVSACFDREHLTTGTLLVNTGNVASALLPVGDSAFQVHPIDTALMVSQPNPAWKPGKVCVMTLATVGAGNFGRVCEVIKAGCAPAVGLRCSKGCSMEVGNVLYLPSGMDIVLGQ